MSDAPTGIFVLAPLQRALAEQIAALTRRFDPRLAANKPPHITLAGSSGLGPIPAHVTPDRLETALAPVARTVAPLALQFLPPVRFMQTEIVVLPLDPHGPLRVLHDRIATSGLPFQSARYTFSPHVTLTLYRTLDADAARELLALRVREPVVIDRIVLYRRRDPQPAVKLLELPLTGDAAAS